MELDGRRLRVDYSITKRPHTPTPGVYMGRPTRSSEDRQDKHERSDRSDRSDRNDRSYEKDRYYDDHYGGGGGSRGYSGKCIVPLSCAIIRTGSLTPSSPLSRGRRWTLLLNRVGSN